MSQVSDRDVQAIRDWLNKEPSLPKNFDDITLKKFLFSRSCSLERTKQRIEEFCIRRACMPEIYTDRDPLSPRLQTVFSYTTVTMHPAGVDELIIYRMTESPKDFDMFGMLKGFSIQADNWINLKVDVLPEKYIIVYDAKCVTLGLIAKMNIFYFQKFMLYLVKGMPSRLRQVHIVNCPVLVDIIFNIIKPAFPEKLTKVIYFHPDHMGLHKFVDKKYLPKEYDGDGESMEEQNAYWLKDMFDKGKIYDDDYWKADLSLRKNYGDTSMDGSFRSLEID